MTDERRETEDVEAWELDPYLLALFRAHAVGAGGAELIVKFFRRVLDADRQKREASERQDLRVIAGVMKKLLPPALLQEVLGYLDPLGEFEAFLKSEAALGLAAPASQTEE